MATTTGGRGAALAYVVVVFGAMVGVISLAVDLGRVQVVKGELQLAADAAARYAAARLGDGVTSARQAAVDAAHDNTADGTPVLLDSELDVEFGAWDAANGSFTVLSGAGRADADSVRVTARRTAARGNAVPLMFAQVIGRSTCDVHAAAIAGAGDPVAGYVGLSLTRMFNTTRFDSYRSTDGPYSAASTRTQAILLGKKDLWLHDACRVDGEAHWGVGGVLVKDPGAVVSPGPLSQQGRNLTFAAVSVGRYATSNDNTQLPGLYLSGNSFVLPGNTPPVTVPGGTYYFTRFDLGLNSTLTFNGRTTIYVAGDCKIQGRLGHGSLRPGLPHLKLTSGSKRTIDSGGMVYAMIYGPGADVHHHNGGQTFGSVISDLLCFRQTSQGHFDESLTGGGGGDGVLLVK